MKVTAFPTMNGGQSEAEFSLEGAKDTLEALRSMGYHFALISLQPTTNPQCQHPCGRMAELDGKCWEHHPNSFREPDQE